MNYKKAKNYSSTVFEIEDHPYSTFIPENVEVLVVGTFPTYKENSRFDFFYSNPDNTFWAILAKVYKTQFAYNEDDQAKFERQKFLEKHRIGITDMILKCYRKDKCSTDESLYPILLNNIFSLLESNTTISKMLLTSRSDVFGALGLLKTYFIQKGLELVHPIRQSNRVLVGEIMLDQRKIEIYVPYSPSPRLIRDNKITFNELVEMYKYCLLK